MGKRWRWLLHGLLAAVGVATIVYLVARVGPHELGVTLLGYAPILPLLLALEAGHILADAWRTQLLYARGGCRVPFRRAFRVQLASYPVNLLVPAGGAASEAYKATALAADAGPSFAAASATTNQALALLGGFVVSLPCIAAAATVWGLSGFTIAISIQAATAIGLGLFIQAATRQRLVGRVVGRFSRRAGDAVGSYQQAVTRLPFVPLAPLCAGILGRCAVLAQLALLAFAAGAPISPLPPFLALGVQMVGGAVGDLVPAQIGATDASFALAAEPLGLDLALAVSIPITLHVVQLGWALVGALLPDLD